MFHLPRAPLRSLFVPVSRAHYLNLARPLSNSNYIRRRERNTPVAVKMPGIKYISQDEAIKIDEELMSPEGAFSIDQLMELAGLACAQTLARCYPLEKGYKKVIVCCGPGNQGGDGLTAARHLHMFGYEVKIFLPKPGKKDIYQRLLKQCQNLHIQALSSEAEFDEFFQEDKCDVVMDAIFGFSFHPPVRAPFATILRSLESSPIPIVSIDIPSGWDVVAGPQKLSDDEGNNVKVLDPDVLLSLTAPKQGAKEFGKRHAGAEGGKESGYRHFLGGRFVPDDLAKKYELNLPKYPDSDQIVELET